MKRIWFTLAIACLAITGTARADVWGRTIPNTMIARTQDKAETVPNADANKSVIQAPPSAIQHDGYPFADRCGGNGPGCCAKLWEGYSSSCGCGIGRGMFTHSIRGCGRLHAHGCNSTCCDHGGCAGLGGFNSFAGGVSYGGCDCGSKRGLGFHAGGLQSLAACGMHHLHGLRHACGIGCKSGCTACGDSNGCNSCNGKSNHVDGADGKKINPPAPPGEPTPMTDKAEEAPSPNPSPASEKSAFRPSYSTSARRLPAGF